jgi:hypothetical protein
VARGPEALLGALLGQPVARADLIPGGPSLASGLNLGGLQVLCRFSQPPGSVEPAHRPVGDLQSAERRGDPPEETLGGHCHSVSTPTPVNDMLTSSRQHIVDLSSRKRVLGMAKKSKKSKKAKKAKKSKKGKK